MNYDQLLSNYLGDFGLYQKWVYFLVCLPAVWCSVNMFVWTFAGAEIPHRCKLGVNDTVFWNPQSTLYTVDNTTEEGGELARCFRRSILNGTLHTCEDGYLYDNREITAGAAQDWNLVCDQKLMKAFVQSLLYLGIFFGSLVLGHMGDKYGRKRVMMVGTFLATLASTLCIYSPNVAVFCVFRFSHGFLEPALWQVPFVLAVELVGPSRRMLAGMIIEFFFSFGLILLGCVAYFIRDWRTLQLVVSLPGLLFLTYYWLIPESPRWLLSVGRREEAFIILRKAARVNRVTLPESVLQQVQAAGEDAAAEKIADQKPAPTSDKQDSWTDNWLALFRTPNIRKKTLICCYCWTTITLLYYAISLNPASIGTGGFYISFILSGCVEIPALTLLIFSLDCLGRKALQFGAFLTVGVCMFALVATPLTASAPLMVEMLLSKLAATTVFSAIYLHTSEMFPTVIRSSAFGLLITCSRLGGIASPFASVFLEDRYKVYVMLTFGILSMVAATLTLYLPETAYQRMPETLEDGEQFGRGVNPCRPGFCPPRPASTSNDDLNGSHHPHKDAGDSSVRLLKMLPSANTTSTIVSETGGGDQEETEAEEQLLDEEDAPQMAAGVKAG